MRNDGALIQNQVFIIFFCVEVHLTLKQIQVKILGEFIVKFPQMNEESVILRTNECRTVADYLEETEPEDYVIYLRKFSKVTL